MGYTQTYPDYVVIILRYSALLAIILESIGVWSVAPYPMAIDPYPMAHQPDRRGFSSKTLGGRSTFFVEPKEVNPNGVSE